MATRRGPDGSVRVAVSGTLGTEPWANVFWANLTGGTTATQAALDAWTTSFGTEYGIVWKGTLASTITIRTCSSVLFQPGGAALHSAIDVTQVGTSPVANVTDLAACRVISWTSSVYWRGGKPRTYLPGLGTDNSTDGKTLTAGTVTALKSLADQWHTAINALSATGITQTQHGFCSFMSGGVALEPGAFHVIGGSAVHPRIGTQRRRLGPWLP